MPSAKHNDVINLVVTCTNRKSSSPPAGLQARNLSGTSTDARARAWSKRLSLQVNGIRASEVYQGDHWSVVRSIATFRGSVRVNVWVASAGYGLLSPESKIVAYAATLAGGHLDSVASSSQERRTWWASLTGVPPKVVPSGPRSIRAVATRFASSPLIIAASPEYIDAMADDILAASERLESPELLCILCRAGGAPVGLMPFVFNLNANLASELGGALTSLNARVLRWLISAGTARLTRKTITRYLGQLSERCPGRSVPKRAKMTDSEVRRQIVLEQHVVHRSRSALLKALREKGYAVEQARFGRIYNEVAEANGAS
jgi:hypothetical protein